VCIYARMDEGVADSSIGCCGYVSPTQAGLTVVLGCKY
jgi:hypothetical protein